MDYKPAMQEYINTEISTLQKLNLDEINAALNAMYNCVNCVGGGGHIFTIGNGGSAATASHMVVDFEKGANEILNTDKKFNLECLSDNTPIITAIANDISYDDIFVFQLEKKLKPGDLLIAISGSGNSRNIIKAVKYAKSINVPVIGVTGYDGGELMKLCDYKLHVPINDMQITEDIHMMFDHMLLRVLCA